MRDLTRRTRRRLALLGAAVVALCATTAIGVASVERQPSPDQGNAKRGAELIAQFGCGACHVVPGVPAARGKVGPPLTGMGARVYIAGVLANTRDNMIHWLQHPQQVVPGNAMPDLGVNETDARDMATYLATLQ